MSQLDGTQVINQQVCYFLTELIEGPGDLQQVVMMREDPMDEALCKFYFKQILEALHYMHEKGVAHRNLTLNNILVDQNFQIKICDFGLSGPVCGNAQHGLSTTRVGLKEYMPPEMISEGSYRPIEADLFAAGVILFIMRVRKQPFGEASVNDSVYINFVENKTDEFWSLWEQAIDVEGFFSAEFKDFITFMF